jgi:hypothetical protein
MFKIADALSISCNLLIKYGFENKQAIVGFWLQIAEMSSIVEAGHPKLVSGL